LTGYKKIKDFLIKYNDESEKNDAMFYEHHGLKYENISNIIGSIYNVFITQVLNFNVIITDAYLLARVFKKFKIYNTNITQRSTDEPEEPHNIIIYAGNTHSQRYRLFLEYLGFRQVESAGNLEKPEPDMTNCVKISDIKQPFFSIWYDYKEDLEPLKMDGISKGSFDLDFQFDTSTITNLFKEPVVPPGLDFQFDTSTITNLFKEPVVPPGLEADASLDRRTPDFMVS
jgi:hypothetical protein